MGALGVVSLVLVGCASRPPAWVRDPAAGLDSEAQFVGVGSGVSSAGAAEEALGSLTYQVAASIDHEPREVEGFADRAASSGYDEPEVTMELLALRGFDASARLVGVQVDSQYYDAKRDTYYARASLERSRLVSAIEREMRRVRAMADRMSDRAGREDVTLRRFSALSTALAMTRAYRELRFIRDRLGGESITLDASLDPPNESIQALQSELAELRSGIAASIEAVGEGPVPLGIEADIKRALQELEVPVRTDAGEGQVRILVGFELTPVFEQREDIKLVNYLLSIELVEDVSGRSIASMTIDDRTGSRTLEDARIHATSMARRDLGERIDDFLRAALFEQSVTP
jgi:hypothetical protein